MRLLLACLLTIFVLPILIVVVLIGGDDDSDSSLNISVAACQTNCEKITEYSGNIIDVKTYSNNPDGKTITVDESVAPNLQRLLDDAYQQGIIFEGWGWRLPEEQIRLRKQNCGGNNRYSIYQKPSSQCTPPTATPGNSMHEKGLAIDFTCNGKKIAGTNCFKWLKTNAANYGFYNLPSEPWHWSTTGR